MNKLWFIALIFNLHIFCAEVDDLVTSPISQGSAEESDSESVKDYAEKDVGVEAVLKEAERQQDLQQKKMQAEQQVKGKLNSEYFENLKKEIKKVIYAIQYHSNTKNHSSLIKTLDLIIRKLIVYYYRADDKLRAEIDNFIKEFEDEQISSLSEIYGSGVIASLFAEDDNDEKSRKQFMSLLTLWEPALSKEEQINLNRFKNSLVSKAAT